MTVPTLSAEQIAAFERDGAICLRGIVGADWLERLWRAGERALKAQPKTPEMAYFRRIRLWEQDADFRDFCTGSSLPSVAARLLRTDKVNLFYDQFFAKEPSFAKTDWHNDQPYWPVRGWPVMSFWVALDRIDATTGAMELIRGSHKWDRWFQPYYVDATGAHGDEWKKKQATFEPLPDFEAERDRHVMLRWDMEPGDAIAFHALTVHSALPNTSKDRRRWAYVIRYCGRDARYYDGEVMNTDITNPALKNGDPLDSAQYPVVYRAG